MLTRLKLKGGLVNNSAQNLLGAGELFTTGDVYYVDSSSGSDGNLGTDPNFPKASLDSAVSAATANNGDIIVLMPNHAENIANATTFQIDKAGLKILGLGEGRNRPTFTFTNASGSVEIDSADTTVSNVSFLAGVASIVTGFNIDANDVTFDGCEFNHGTAGYNFIKLFDVTGVNRFTLRNSKFIFEHTADKLTYAVYLSNYEDVSIEGNFFSGFATSAYVCDVSGGGNESDHLRIVGNEFYNGDSRTTAMVIDINSTATGIIAYNAIFSLNAATTPGGIYDPGSCGSIEVYATTAVDRAATLIG